MCLNEASSVLTLLLFAQVVQLIVTNIIDQSDVVVQLLRHF